jgi:hypothetical protein
MFILHEVRPLIHFGMGPVFSDCRFLRIGHRASQPKPVPYWVVCG